MRLNKLRAQSCKTACTSADCKSLHATCTSDWLAINWGSHNPLPWVWEFARTVNRTQSNVYVLLAYSIRKEMTKYTDWTAQAKDTQGKIWKRSECRSFCLYGVVVPSPTQHIDVFTNPEIPKPIHLGFSWKLHHMAWSINSISIPSLLFWERGLGWKL